MGDWDNLNSPPKQDVSRFLKILIEQLRLNIVGIFQKFLMVALICKLPNNNILALRKCKLNSCACFSFSCKGDSLTRPTGECRSPHLRCGEVFWIMNGAQLWQGLPHFAPAGIHTASVSPANLSIIGRFYLVWGIKRGRKSTSNINELRFG